MTTKHKPEGTASKAVETTNSNNGNRVVTSKASNFGQFGYTLTVGLTPEQVEAILQEGILHIAQRAPASRVEKILAGYDKREDMGSEWTRDQIAYSDETARQFEVEMAREFQKVAHIAATVSADRYEVTEREPAYAEAKKIVKAAMKLGKAAVAKLASNVGYTGKDTTLDSIDFLQAVESDRQRRNAAMFA